MIGLLMMLGAAQMTLGDLRTICANDRASCNLYILGVAGGFSLGDGAAKGGRVCLPDDVSQTELSEVVLRLAKADLDRFPDDLAMPAVSFISAAVVKQYPCR